MKKTDTANNNIIKDMERAGAEVLMDYDPEYDLYGEFVWKIYEAMERAREVD